MAKKTMTEGARKVLAYLQSAGAGTEFTTKQVQEALGFEKSGSVTGSINGLVKKGCADRTKKTVETEDGKKKEISVFWLTEKGMTYDPDAEVAED